MKKSILCKDNWSKTPISSRWRKFDKDHKFNIQLKYIYLIHIDSDIIYIDENKDAIIHTPTVPIVYI